MSDKKVVHTLQEQFERLLGGETALPVAIGAEQDADLASLAGTLNRFITEFNEVREFGLALASGRLEESPLPRNLLASSFKQLHAALRHLTWQTEQIARGDYSQRVRFMGDFSNAFNSMVDALARSEARLRESNEELQMQGEELQAQNKELSRLWEESSRTEEAVRKLNEELESFSYSISHDLRAPLRAIDGFARILGEEYEASLDHEGTRLLSVIRKNTARMGELIDDLLAFSRIGRQELRRTVVPMRDIALEVFEELRKSEGKRSIRLHLAPLPPALGDPPLIRQALQNLIDNSIKYTRPRQCAEVEVGCRCAEGEHIYFVRDNGVGFDMKYVDKLFGVFQRLHGAEEFEGTGVGLAIAQRIIQRHGGRIWGEGEVDGGAAFHFTLPSIESATARAGG
jgi:signal transduction histidine kinase